MRTVTHRTASLLGGLALLAGILLALSAPARAQAITAEPQTVIVAKDAAQGATTITWDAGAGIKSLGATLWQQIDGGKETLVAATAKGSQSILIGAGQTRVFKLHNFIKSKVLASVTVTATVQGAAPDENAPNAGVAPVAKDAPDEVAAVSSEEGPPPPISFTGVWNTALGTGKEIEVSLQQTGDKVTGTYMPGSAHIKDGVVTGRVLRFQWTQDDGLSGSGRFEMGADGSSFSGSSSSSKDPDAAGTPWNGTREPVSFWGCWKLTGGSMDDNTICLRQESRGRVTATMGDFEGMASGNTLRFTHRPAGAHRSGRFIMDEGGKSFRGFWHTGDDTELNEDPCTGILVPVPKK